MPTKTRPAPATDRRAVSHQLREAIGDDGRTAYALGKASGDDAGMIQRFVNRERGLTLETVDRLALALGMRLVETGRGRGRPSKPGRPGRDRTGSAEIVETEDDRAEAEELVHSGPSEATHDQYADEVLAGA